MKGKSIVERSANQSTQQGIEIVHAQDLTWLMLMILVMLSALIAQIYGYIPKLRTRQSANLKRRHQDTCHRCKYFHQNLYLKCALHPSTALTEDSIDCKDYSPKN